MAPMSSKKLNKQNKTKELPWQEQVNKFQKDLTGRKLVRVLTYSNPPWLL